jgi:hypothetical protein
VSTFKKSMATFASEDLTAFSQPVLASCAPPTPRKDSKLNSKKGRGIVMNRSTSLRATRTSYIVVHSTCSVLISRAYSLGNRVVNIPHYGYGVTLKSDMSLDAQGDPVRGLTGTRAGDLLGLDEYCPGAFTRHHLPPGFLDG